MFQAILLLLLLFATALPAVAQNTARSLLWRITGNGVDKPSYLFGTVHSRDDRAFGVGDTVLAAMSSVSVVAGELDIEKGRQDAIGLMAGMMLPDGKRLEEFYKKKDRELIQTELEEKLGPMAAMAQRMKPFFVMAMLTEATMIEDEEHILDEYILNTARGQGQRVIGLETMKEQMAAMDALPLKDQAALLLDHVKNDGHQSELDAMMDAYEAQDLDRLMTVTKDGSSMTKALEKALLTDRNERMVHRLDSVMQGDEDIFFAVGAAHLAGNDGLIELLKQKGYSVEPVMYTPARRESEPALEKY